MIVTTKTIKMVKHQSYHIHGCKPCKIPRRKTCQIITRISRHTLFKSNVTKQLLFLIKEYIIAMLKFDSFTKLYFF